MSDSASIIVSLLVALIAAGPPSLLAYAAYRTAQANIRKLDGVASSVDGRLSELVKTTGELQRAQGVVQGRGEQAQLQVQTATPVVSAEPLQVVIVPNEDEPLPVTVVEGDKP